MKKYKVWMMQEGRKKADIIDIFCIGCGKKMSEHSTMYYDNDRNHAFCTVRCSKNINWELEQEQRWRFSVESCKEMGLIT